MVTRREDRTQKGAPMARRPQSLKLAQAGIRTAQDFANVMGALMTDLLSDKVPPHVANATCNAGGKMLKAVEMQFKYGKKTSEQPERRELTLALDS